MNEETKVTAATEDDGQELTLEQVNSLRQVRIGKLGEIKAAGRDP